MSKIKNGGLDQYGAEPFEWQQFGTPGVEGVKRRRTLPLNPLEGRGVNWLHLAIQV